MASTTPKSEATPPPTFSYAQAAKGRPTYTTSAVQSSQASVSGFSTPAKESNINTPSASVNGTGESENGDRFPNGGSENLNKVDPLGVGIDPKATSQVSTGSIPVSPSVGTASTTALPKEDEITLSGTATTATDSEPGWEKVSAHGTNNDRSSEAHEGRKGGRKSKKQRKDEKETEKEKDKKEEKKEEPKEEVKPEILVPAPPPAVNFWEQRKAATAKLSPSAAQSPFEASKPTESRKKGKTGDDVRDKSLKKSPESLKKDDNKRPARGSRGSDKEEKSTQLPPPVDDSMAWPTPETALEEEKRKAHEKEKSEKEEKDETSNTGKPRSKEKWVPVPYTPSVQFNTPLPVRGARGRGGAGNRGGRDSTGRGGHLSNGTEKVGIAKPIEEERHGRGESGVRSSSLPPNSSKRLSSGDVARDSRPIATPSAEKVRGKSDVSPTDVRRTSIATQTGDKPQTGVEGFKAGPPKDQRTDGRPDRGRGNAYRGRGTHTNFPNGQHAHPFPNGHAAQIPGGYAGRPNGGPYSPPLQPPFNNHTYHQAPPRGRGGSRSQSIPNSGGMYQGRFPNGPQMPPIQTMYDYPTVPVHPMSAMPYNGLAGAEAQQFTILSMVTMQLEYYFSIDNLCKDVFLRKHMDSQGFVYLSFVAKFKRIQSLTSDFEMLRFACISSSEIEIFKGEDDVDRIRRRDGWEKWVLPSDDRDESMKGNDGPRTLYPSQLQQYAPMMQNPFPPNGSDFRYGNGGPVPPPTMNGNGHYHPETPLSAAVPDFAPGQYMNGTTPNSAEPLESETTFTDEEVENLNLVFTQPRKHDSRPSRVPFHTAASRTFSNGSIDGRSISEELYEERQGRSLVNGSHSAASTSPGSQRHSTFSPTSQSPPVMWVKGAQPEADEKTENEPYTTFRDRALKSRSIGESNTDMDLLYKFWAHFLCRNFNPKMYYEFRRLALEDGENNSFVGLEQLVLYYDETLINKKKTIHDQLAAHYIEVVKGQDSEVQRSAFQKLRSAWRNGALDLKSRKKIDNLLDPKLKEQLEQ